MKNIKKSFLLVSVLMILGISSLFGADFSWGGGFYSVWAVNMDVDSDYNFGGVQAAFLSTNIKIDDFNTVSAVLEYGDNGKLYNVDPRGFIAKEPNLFLKSTELKTDIFGAWGLDVPVNFYMLNGYGKLNIHDRYSGVGTGWDPEIFKKNGALDGGDDNYVYTGFDWSVEDKIFFRFYTGPGTWNPTDFTFLTEIWAPIPVGENSNLDIGGWLVLEDGYILGKAEETIPIEPDGEIWTGFRLKGDTTVNNVVWGFWLGGLLYTTTRYDYTKNDGSQKFDETLVWTFVEAGSLTVNIDESMNFKFGIWFKEELKSRFGDDLKEFESQIQSVRDIDPYLSCALDFQMNYRQLTIYGGIVTTDFIVDQQGAERTNGRWEFGVGYQLGASDFKLGVTGPLITKDIGVAAATLPTYDGLGVVQPVINNPATGGNVTFPVIYFTAGAYF